MQAVNPLVFCPLQKYLLSRKTYITIFCTICKVFFNKLLNFLFTFLTNAPFLHVFAYSEQQYVQLSPITTDQFGGFLQAPPSLGRGRLSIAFSLRAGLVLRTYPRTSRLSSLGRGRARISPSVCKQACTDDSMLTWPARRKDAGPFGPTPFSINNSFFPRNYFQLR